MARYLLRVRVLSRATGKRLTFATSHFDAGRTDEIVTNLAARTKGETYGTVRRAMLQEACEALAAEEGDGVIFAGDFNLRDREVPGQGLDEPWLDAWVADGAKGDRAVTWSPKDGVGGAARYDRVLFSAREAVGEDAAALLLAEDSFRLLSAGGSDHKGVACAYEVRLAADRGDGAASTGAGPPNLRGVRGVAGCSGIAWRPLHSESCAKAEIRGSRAGSAPLSYCGKHFEKPRVKKHCEAVVEDPRRPGLFRLHLARNCAVVNSMHVLLAIALGANCDGQAVLTTKGAADYVAKYISKYGAGQSVHKHIANLLDDIVCNTPEGRTMTVSSLLAKAFIATSVPEALCSGEAWHILWRMERTVCTRKFKPLNLDGLRGLKKLDAPQKPDKPMATKDVIEKYRERMQLNYKGGADLAKISLWRFASAFEANA